MRFLRDAISHSNYEAPIVAFGGQLRGAGVVALHGSGVAFLGKIDERGRPRQARWNFDYRPITRWTSARAPSQAIRSLIPSASRARARAATAVSIGSQMSASASSAAAIELGVG